MPQHRSEREFFSFLHNFLMGLENEEEGDVEIVAVAEDKSDESKFSGVSERASAALAIGGYAICSSLMLVANKIALGYYPSVALLMIWQCLSTAVIVKTLEFVPGVRLDVDPLTLETSRKMAGVVLSFVATIYVNARALKSTGVGTVIFIRSLGAFIVGFVDSTVLGGLHMTRAIVASLCVMSVGSLAYGFHDVELQSEYLWPLAYLAVSCFDMVYTKHVLNTVQMTTWGRSFYINFFSLFPLLIISGVVGELRAANVMMTIPALSAIGVTCVLGTAFSFFGFKCRAALSATAFNVMGNANKVISIVVSSLIWTHDNNVFKLSSLGIVLLGVFLFARGVQSAKDMAAGHKEMIHVSSNISNGNINSNKNSNGGDGDVGVNGNGFNVSNVPSSDNNNSNNSNDDEEAMLLDKGRRRSESQ